MKLFQLLHLVAPLEPTACKIHLACYNGIDDPLDIYYAGNFKAWQEGQNNKNFERRYILGLIKLPARNCWLYAGTYSSQGCAPRPSGTGFVYRTEEKTEYSEYLGRLVVEFERPGRQSYLLAENWADQLEVVEIRRKRLSIQEFPGYRKVCIRKSELDTIIKESVESWRAALSNVAGVYLITDRCNGKLYVGSASGAGGIWQRWCAYSQTVHGGNAELIDIVRTLGASHGEHFQFSILEICDSNASQEDVLERESHWKKILGCIVFGYNKN